MFFTDILGDEWVNTEPCHTNEMISLKVQDSCQAKAKGVNINKLTSTITKKQDKYFSKDDVVELECFY
jgi:hypothetical protein